MSNKCDYTFLKKKRSFRINITNEHMKKCSTSSAIRETTPMSVTC